MLDLNSLTNPVFRRCDNLRDPAVLPVDGGYMLYYTRYSNGVWGKAENWSVAGVFTPDFRVFEDDRDITPKNFASPGEPVWWHDRLIMPFQSYPEPPQRLYYSVCEDDRGRKWSDPIPILDAVLDLPWNGKKRAIDISFAVDGDILHAWFVANEKPGCTDPRRQGNLLGHAMTRDPMLKEWQITSVDEPLIGSYERAPDGVENTMVYRAGGKWVMAISEGIEHQHLAYALSDDLMNWSTPKEIPVPQQQWFAYRYGAPFVWREQDGRYIMVFMGEENDQNRSSLGLMHSDDGFTWQLLPESSDHLE